MSIPGGKALIVGGDPAFRKMAAAVLETRGFAVSACPSLEAGSGQFGGEQVVLTVIPAGANGEVGRFLDDIRTRATPRQPVIVGIGDPPAGPTPLRGFDDLLLEPVERSALGLCLDSCLVQADRPKRSGGGATTPAATDDPDREQHPFGAPPLRDLPPAPAPAPGQADTGTPRDEPSHPSPTGGRGVLERILARPHPLGQSSGPGRSHASPPPPTAGDPLPAATFTPATFTPAAPEPDPEPERAPEPESEPEPLAREPEPPASGAPAPAPATAPGTDPNLATTTPVDTASPAEVPTGPAARPGPAAAATGPAPDPDNPFRTLLENAPLAMALFDRDMRYLAVNRLWLDEFHLHSVPLLGRSQYQVFPDLHPSWRGIYEHCLAGHTERCDEDVFRRADGSQDWVRWEVRPWFDPRTPRDVEDETPAGVVITCEVITHLKKAQRQLHFERNLASALFSTHPAPVMVVDLGGKVVRANAAAKRLAPCEHLVENAAPYWNQLLTGDQRDAAAAFFATLDREDNRDATVPATHVETLHLASGETTVTWLNIPQRSGDGRIEAIVRVGTVLPDAAPAAAPAPTQARPAAPPAGVLDALPVAAWRCDTTGQLTHTNPAWLELRGITAGGPDAKARELGKGWLKVFPEDSRRPVAAAVASTLKNGGHFSVPCHFTTGTTSPMRVRVLLQARASTGPDGRIDGLVGTVTPLPDPPAPATPPAATQEDGAAAEAKARAEADAGEIAGLKQRLDELTRSEKLLQQRVTALTSLKSAAESQAQRAAATAAAAAAAGSGSGPGSGSAPAEGSSAASTAAVDITEHAPFGFLLVGATGECLYRNPQHVALLGSDAAGFPSVEAWLADRCADATHRSHVTSTWRDKVWRKQVRRVLPLLNGDGILKEIEFRPSLLDDGRLLLVLSDVTETHRSNEALRTSEVRFRALLRDCGIPFAAADKTGGIFCASAALERMLGFSSLQLRRLSLDDCIAPEDIPAKNRLLAEGLASPQGTHETTLRCLTIEGIPIPCRTRVALVHDDGDGDRIALTALFFHPVKPDAEPEGDPESKAGSEPAGRQAATTEPAPSASGDSPESPQPTASASPQTTSASPDPSSPPSSSNQTRQDLQIVASLLNLQQAATDDSSTRSALAASQSRVRALGFIHSTLPAGDPGAPTDFPELARQLTGHVLDQFGDDTRSRVEVVHTGSMPPCRQQTAVSLALVLNELVTNALRHGFAGGTSGTIEVAYSPGRLAVRDDGSGLPPTGLEESAPGLGLQIVRSLAEQLDGHLAIADDDETEFAVTFRDSQ